MNRLILAALGGIAGISLAVILAPASRKERERIGRVAGEPASTNSRTASRFTARLAGEPPK
jgi:hypothetical protein